MTEQKEGPGLATIQRYCFVYYSYTCIFIQSTLKTNHYALSR